MGPPYCVPISLKNRYALLSVHFSSYDLLGVLIPKRDAKNGHSRAYSKAYNKA